MYDIIINVPRGTAKVYKCLDGGIGRRTGLKILWYLYRAGSIPALGTIYIAG